MGRLISGGTIISGLMSERLTQKFGVQGATVTGFGVVLIAFAFRPTSTVGFVVIRLGCAPVCPGKFNQILTLFFWKYIDDTWFFVV